MNFSTALKLNDVDDYIAPSLECIKPVKIPTSAGKTKSITIGDDGSYVATNESGQKYTLSKAKIELNDCLACSGCITTAETILVSQHSVTTFIDLLKDPSGREIVVSISPQSLASLAVAVTADLADQSHQKLASFFAQTGLTGLNGVREFCARILKSHGVAHVLDTTWSRDLSLAAAAEEFVGAFNGEQPQLPILAGICPGWICYAEKTHFKAMPGKSGDNPEDEQSFLLPHLSRVRSPQQLLAGTLKRPSGTTANPLFTVFVEPCYDRKLEASRVEFTLDNGKDKEADLVLGTNEFISVLESLLEEVKDGTPATGLGETPRLSSLFTALENPTTPTSIETYRHAGSGSGGYAINILRFAADKLFQVKLSPTVIDDPRVLTRTLGNQDMQEILLFSTPEDCAAAKANKIIGRTPYRQIGASPAPLLAFLVANGFRNIQTVVQQLKRSYTKAHSTKQPVRTQAPFDYVEVMACPSGCLNGGAQLKEASLANVSEAYFSMPQRDILASEPSQALLAAMDPDTRHKNSHTTYRSVPKVDIINPSSLKW